MNTKTYYWIGGGVFVLFIIYLLLRKNTSGTDPLISSAEAEIKRNAGILDAYIMVGSKGSEVLALQKKINEWLTAMGSKRKQLVEDSQFGLKTQGALREMTGKSYLTKDEYDYQMTLPISVN